jgi:hypothetical protein
MNQEQRREALRKLCDRVGLEIKPDGPWDTSGEEDIAEFFENSEVPAKDIHEWAVVTQHDEYDYVYPQYDDLDAAIARAEEFVGDSTFGEFPVEIVNLDSGEKFTPRITFTWSKEVRLDV